MFKCKSQNWTTRVSIFGVSADILTLFTLVLEFNLHLNNEPSSYETFERVHSIVLPSREYLVAHSHSIEMFIFVSHRSVA